LAQVPRVEVGVARPRAREGLVQHAALHRLGHVEGILVLVDLHGSPAAGERVGRGRAYRRLDAEERVAHPANLVRTLCACPGKPSARATRTIPSATRRRPRGVIVTTLCRRWKSRTESGDEKRAVPPVGRTWFGAIP